LEDIVVPLVRNGTMRNYTQCVENPQLGRLASQMAFFGDDAGLNNTRGTLCRRFYTEASFIPRDTADKRKPEFRNP
jgi:hypothetical protein